MNGRLPYSFFVNAIVIWSVVGYPLIASMTTMLGIDNRPISILFRATVVMLSLSLIARGLPRINLRPSRTILSFTTFLVIYLLRMTAGTLFDDGQLGHNAIYYWNFGVGACFLPALALLFAQNSPDPQSFERWVIIFGTLTVLVAAAFGSTTVISTSGQAYDSGRVSLDALNPIAFGHVGATLFLTVYWKLQSAKFRIATHFSYVIVAGIGLLALGLSGSRGPLVALVSAMLFIEASKGGPAIAWKVTVLFIIALFLSFNFTFLDKEFDIELFSRLQESIDLSDPSSIGRVRQLSSALQLFLEHPVFGTTFEDPTFKIYPHNIIVEALMATGLIGTAALLFFLLGVLKKAFLFLKKNSDFSIFSVLFVQYAVAAQFSGAIYSSNSMWVLATVVASKLCLNTTHRRDHRARTC